MLDGKYPIKNRTRFPPHICHWTRPRPGRGRPRPRFERHLPTPRGDEASDETSPSPFDGTGWGRPVKTRRPRPYSDSRAPAPSGRNICRTAVEELELRRERHHESSLAHVKPISLLTELVGLLGCGFYKYGAPDG